VEAFVAAGGGFLLAVLWFDLMFDVQARGHRDAELPEPVLASTAAYYRRVTTTARPMNLLVAAAMLGTLAAVVVELVNDDVESWVAWTSLVLVVTALVIARTRTVPGAVRLGARRDTLVEQSRIARAIQREHVACFVLIAALIVLQLVSAAT
jgi:hypothetical protein